jgi:hypothetical protein
VQSICQCKSTAVSPDLQMIAGRLRCKLSIAQRAPAVVFS